MSYARYAAIQATTEHPREMEIRAFVVIAKELEASGSEQIARLTALHRNVRLWALLQADLLHEGNRLPVPLKGMLISLAIHSQKISMQAMGDNRSLLPLIELNRDMAEALAIQRQAHAADAPGDLRPATAA